VSLTQTIAKHQVQPAPQCIVGHFQSKSYSIARQSTGGVPWISGGFAVQKTWKTGNTYECKGNRGQTVCIKNMTAMAAYTVNKGLGRGLQRRDRLGPREHHHLEPQQEQRRRWLLLRDCGDMKVPGSKVAEEGRSRWGTLRGWSRLGRRSPRPYCQVGEAESGGRIGEQDPASSSSVFLVLLTCCSSVGLTSCHLQLIIT
jgi:hypothetical protein